MMPSTFPRLLALLLTLVAGGAYAQNIEEERQKIEHFRQQASSLQASNAAIEKQLQQLEQDIASQAKSYAPEAKALKEAEFNYQQALRTSERVPNASNKERAETARFAFLMAERKYQRSTEGVTELAKQQTALREQLADNKQQISSTNVQLGQQQELILQLEKQAREQATALAKKKERKLQMKKESALRDNREALDRARNERAAAMAELAELKAKLEAQKRAKRRTVSTLPAAAAGVTVASNRPNSSPTRSQLAPLTARLPMDEEETEGLPSLLGDKAQYMALLETARQLGSRARSSKIMHMNTLADDRIVRKTSHSLKHRGNGVYEGKTPVRAGMTTLVVGSKQWRWEIPGSDNNTMYRFVLDTRDNSNTELKIFRSRDVK
jgi:chromosome segregation ATPase